MESHIGALHVFVGFGCTLTNAAARQWTYSTAEWLPP